MYYLFLLHALKAHLNGKDKCFIGGDKQKLCSGDECPKCWVPNVDLSWDCYVYNNGKCDSWSNMYDVMKIKAEAFTVANKMIGDSDWNIPGSPHKKNSTDKDVPDNQQEFFENNTSYSAKEPSKLPDKEHPIPDKKNQTDYPIKDPSKNNTADKRLCSLPNDSNIIPITPEAANQGWAMSPDQSCSPGKWCPYACKPGMYSNQWDLNSRCGAECGSMNGGLYCDHDGLRIPKPNEPLCKSGLGNVLIENKLNQKVSLCQTVYPGNEAMIIPTVVHPHTKAQINVVPNSYWKQTSADYYVNLAGSDQSACIWGTDEKPVGNWAPYLIGAGQGKDANTYVSVRTNPLFKQRGFGKSGMYNIEIKCTGRGCLGFPCGFDSKKGDNQDCTFTLTKGSKAIISFKEIETSYHNYPLSGLLDKLI